MSDVWPPPPSGPDPWTQPMPGDPLAPTTNGVAIAAMIVGIITALTVLTVVLSFLAFLPGVVAIGLGIAGLRRSNRHPTRLGRVPAITGIICGAIGTVASVVVIAIIALFVASSDFALVDERPAAPDDYELADRSCDIDDDLAVASGVLTNRSGIEHGWAITVRFLDGEQELDTVTTELEGDLADGASWEWTAKLPVDTAEVNTDSLDCRVDEVVIGTSVSD